MSQTQPIDESTQCPECDVEVAIAMNIVLVETQAGTEVAELGYVCPGCSHAWNVEADDVTRPTATDGGQVQACPECDSVNIHPRNGRQRPGTARTWHCSICGADFDDPDLRPPKSTGGTVSLPGGSGAAALDRMDPDDLVTDGGQDAGEIATRLIELRDEFEDIGEHVQELDIRDREMLVDVIDDQAELCLQLAQAIEIRAVFDPQDHKIGDDQVLTDGGTSEDGQENRPDLFCIYRCSDCGAVRRTADLLREHIRSEHPDGDAHCEVIDVLVYDVGHMVGPAVGDDQPVTDGGRDRSASEEWPYCPNCGSELDEPAGPYRERTTCPECGVVDIEFWQPEGER